MTTTKILKLIKARQPDFELQSWSTLRSRQRNKKTSLEAVLTSSMQLLTNCLQGAFPVCGRDVVGKAGEVHGSLPSESCEVNPAHIVAACLGAAGAAFSYLRIRQR